MVEEWATVRRAARLRGGRSWNLELSLLVPVLAASLRRATSLATAITCRGFDATRPRTFYPELRMRGGERAAMVLVVALGAGVSIVKSLYWLAEGNLYRTSLLEPLYQFASDWL